MLPPNLAEQFKVETAITIELNPKNLAKLATLDKEAFRKAKEAFDEGRTTLNLYGELALKWIEQSES